LGSLLQVTEQAVDLRHGGVRDRGLRGCLSQREKGRGRGEQEYG
jgi:hypothetical protein